MPPARRATAADPPPPEEPRIRPFADWLREQAKGKSHEELGEGLHALVARVQDTGKKGSITYTVVVSPIDKDGEALKIVDEIKIRFPEHDREASLFFTDSDGNLSRSDPNQLTFESLREVPPPNVDPVTGEIKENTPS